MNGVQRSPSPSVRTRDLSLWYGQFQALKDVSVDIAAGAITGLIGPSGSGKSSLLHAAGMLERPSGGDVRIAGVSGWSLGDDARTEAKSRVYIYEQKDRFVLDKALERKFRTNKKAWDYFLGQAPYYRKLMTGWLNMAKAEETRLRRLDKLMAACESGKRLGAV